MDPRLEHRRRRVAEDRARSNLGRLVWLLVLVAVAAGLLWLARSPFLSVARIEVEGAERVDVNAALESHRIAIGRPMLLLDIDGTEAALRADPWVAEAEVGRDWPTLVIVRVVERTAAATVGFSDGWWLVAADGTVLAEAAGPDPALGVAEFPRLASGEADDDLDVTGAVAFLAALPPSRRPGTTVGPTEAGLEASLDGFAVRLGRPFDMEEKADVALAVIDAGLEAGSVITVVAPASPAVLPPGGESAAPDEDGTEAEAGEGGTTPTDNQP